MSLSPGLSGSVAGYVEQFALGEALNPALLRCLRLYSFPAQTALYTQSADTPLLYLLVEGRVQVTYDHPTGTFGLLAMMSPLAVIGDVEIFEPAENYSNVITLENSVCLGIEKRFVLQYGADDPRFLRFIIRHLVSKLVHASLIQTTIVLPLAARLAAYLLRQPSNPIVLPGRGALAALLGTTPRHLNRVLKQLHDSGLITASGTRIQVLNAGGLEALIER